MCQSILGKNQQPKIREFLFNLERLRAEIMEMHSRNLLSFLDIHSTVTTGNINNEENKFHFNDGRQFSISIHLKKGHYKMLLRTISQTKKFDLPSCLIYKHLHKRNGRNSLYRI